MSNNLLTNNVFYTAQQYVDGTQYTTPQVARTDDNLLYPIIEDASKYNVALAKCSVPLGNIPLTHQNIPLKQYQVTLRNGSYEASAYLRQLNASTKDFLFNCTEAGMVYSYTYSSTGSMVFLSSVDLSIFVPNGVAFYCVDDFKNMYLATSSIPYGLIDKIVIVNITSVLLVGSLSCTSIQCMDLDRQNRLYIGDEIVGSSVVKVYNNANSASNVILTLATTITTDFDGNPLVSIRTLATDQSLIVGYDTNRFCLYNTTNFQPITGFQNTTISHLGKASAVNSSGQGTFCIVDDSMVDDVFVTVKSSVVGPNLYNASTGVLFGDGGIWNLGTKIAFAKTYGVGIGTDNFSYAFPYNSTTGQPTGSPSLFSSTPGLQSVTSFESRNNLLFSSTAGVLYGCNLDNLGTNNLSIINTGFTLSSIVPSSWDYQPHSRKIIGIDSTDYSVHSTTQPVFGKNFFSITQPIQQIYLSLYGSGVNDNSQGPGTTSLVSNATYTLSNMAYYDACPLPNGLVAMVGIQLNTTNYFLQVYSLLTGSLVNSWPIYSNHPQGIIHLGGNFTAIMFEDGTLKTYNINTGFNAQTISTGLVSTGQALGCFISGGQNNTVNRKVIFLTFKGTLKIYTSLSNGTGYTNVLTATGIVPNGQVYAQYFGGGYFHGDGLAASPTLYLMSSGSNPAPFPQTMQAIVRFAFTDATYSAIDLTNTIQIMDGKKFAYANSWNSILTGSYRINEIYCAMSDDTNGFFNNTMVTYNLGTATQTSQTTLDWNQYSQPTVYYPMEGLYTWQTIAVSGVSTIQSVAVNRASPNTLYFLDSFGATYKGTLNNLAISVLPYSALPTAGTNTSLSITQDGVTYDSYVKCYTLSNQQQVGSTEHFQGKTITSIGRNDVSLNYTIAVAQTGFYMYSSDSFVQTGSSHNTLTAFCYTKAGEDIDSGPADIYDYTVFVNALNAALDEAYVRLKGNGGTLISSPSITLDYGTQLYTLNYSSDYTKLSNGIVFNDALLRLVKFYSVKESLTGMNKLVLPLNSTSILQTSKSAYKFNKLAKICFQSTTIFVVGSYAGSNSQNQTITDVDVPIDTFIDNQGEILFYQPSLLRPYILGSNNSIQRVELRVFYQYNDGTQYNLLISPDDSWSSLFCFVKKV
jgi:hypothetical protein